MEAQNPSLGLGWVWGITYLHPAVLAHCALESRLLALLARPEQSREGSWLPAACPLTGSFAGQCCVVAPQLPMAQEPSWGTWPAFVPPPRHLGPVRFPSQSKPSLWPLQRRLGRGWRPLHRTRTPPRHRHTSPQPLGPVVSSGDLRPSDGGEAAPIKSQTGCHIRAVL